MSQNSSEIQVGVLVDIIGNRAKEAAVSEANHRIAAQQREQALAEQVESLRAEIQALQGEIQSMKADSALEDEERDRAAERDGASDVD